MDWQTRYRKLGVSEPDIARLEAFIALAEEIRGRRYFSKEGITFTAQGGVGMALEFSSDDGDVEDFRSALMSVRKLISDGEPTFVNSIVNILFKAEPPGERRDRLAAAYAEQKRGRQEPVEATVSLVPGKDGWPIQKGRTREALLKQLINTQLFHGDTPPADALPDMKGSAFTDDELSLTLLRKEAITMALGEAAFAWWLKGFIEDDE